MKKSICLYFQVHQPNRLRLYRFFDIGKDSHYYDDFSNRTILRRVSQRCYLPANALLLELINRYKGQFKVTFSISGSVLEQFEIPLRDILPFAGIIGFACRIQASGGEAQGCYKELFRCYSEVFQKYRTYIFRCYRVHGV